MNQSIDNATLDPKGLQRVLAVFERSYRISSADFYRAHMRNESPAAEVSSWHREIWSGTYRQWLRKQGAEDAWRRVGG